MRIGISTASFFNRIPTESAFDILRQMRVDTTEVFLNTFSEYEKPFVDALVPRRGNLYVHSVHCLGTQFEPQLFSANVRVRADAENLFRKVCYAGYILGAKFYTFHGPVRLKKRTYTFDYIKIGNRINQLVDIAHSYGINLSYENVHWAYGSDPEYFRQLLKQCPALYTTLDVKQATQAGQDPVKFLDAMEGRISTVHLCDVDKAGDTALPGQGKVNFERFFREAEKRNLNAPALVEAYPRDYKDLNELKAAYDYIANIVIKVKNK
ncbi:MAG: sugar phosphate isomerase/epimerase [Clostridia bacterium]|nr:sugar phosphate isomerase/epimerase [Clostridia bacterium]